MGILLTKLASGTAGPLPRTCFPNRSLPHPCPTQVLLQLPTLTSLSLFSLGKNAWFHPLRKAGDKK